MATAIRRTEAELKALMPNQIIPPIGSDTVEPTWQQIQLCSTLCAANAASIDSDGGDGLLGHVLFVSVSLHHSHTRTKYRLSLSFVLSFK
jgi:hypothetical protein